MERGVEIDKKVSWKVDGCERGTDEGEGWTDGLPCSHSQVQLACFAVHFLHSSSLYACCRYSTDALYARRSSDVRNGVLKGLVLSTAVLAMIFFFEVAFFPSHLFKRDKSDHDYDEKVGHVS